ncbi:MAG: carcinine hydrolase/isopenicillin-N N-acyltransferase family protein, partial [Bacteroidota bacterium]
IGWVGFIGALSGIKPGKFSLTLNAVLSNDSPEIALPISFLLRDILDGVDSFNEARKQLEHTVIASDCLLLLSGINSNEMVVIERTPRRFASQESKSGFIIVTNDYKELENNPTNESVLQSTSCGRYNRVEEMLKEDAPTNLRECFTILKDKKIMMGITVQQMVFNNKTGEILLIKTDSNAT